MDWHGIFTQSLQQGLGPTAIVYCLAAIGLNVHFGYTGLLNFGQAGFMAVAGYALASSVATWGLSFWAGIVIGLLLTVVLALLLGVPTLRLRADYLAIVTIAAAEIIRQVVGSVTLLEWFGGLDGLQNFNDSFASLNPFDKTMGIDGVVTWRPYDFFVVCVGWTLVALSCLVVFLLMRSPWGRVLKSIREDEDAVRSLGKNVYAYKMQSLIIGGVLGCLGGFIYALGQASIQPDIFGTDTTFFAYTLLILGGAARVASPVVGAMIFWVILSLSDNVLNEAIDAGYISKSVITTTQVGQFRFMIVGALLMALMIFRPQGIFGDRREIALDAR